MSLNPRSLKNLNGVHDDLVRVVTKAAEKCPFLVTEGVRSKSRQLELVKAGKSQTKNSRHLYGLAVDLCDPDGCYDIDDMRAIARAMKSAAAELDIPIQWGGDWRTFKDTPHFELDRKAYPDNGAHKPWALKPGDKEKALVVGGASGVAVRTASDAGVMPTFDQAADLVIRSGNVRIGLVALVVGLGVYFGAPALARRLGWGV